MRALKTPLRFPGDNVAYASKIASHFPKRIRTVCSPFFTGGSVEIQLVNKGTNVYGYSYFTLLVEFWQCLLRDPNRLYKIINHFYPIEEERMFYHMQDTISNHEDIFLRSAIFYICNRSTECGNITHGKFATKNSNFNDLSMLQLTSFRTNRLHVKNCLKYTDAISENVVNYLFCAPPKYRPESLLMMPVAQEQLNINHVELRSILAKRNNWLLLYNFHPKLLKLYDGCSYKMMDKNFRVCDDATDAKNIIFTN